jgi:hypothetical protein
LARLELLVRDRRSCLGRIAFLRAGTGKAGQPFPASQRAPGREFAAEIDLLAEGRLFDDLLAGQLPSDRVGRLHRLTCDADALWAAHVRTTTTPPVRD